MCSCNRGRGSGSGGGGLAPSVAKNPAIRPAARTATGAPAGPGPVAPAVAAVAVAAPPPISIPTVDTSVWGAALWKVLHTASVFSQKRTQMTLWRDLVKALKTGLPCPDCSAHYNAWAASHRINFSMFGDGIRGPTVQWVLALHNNVNSRLDPPVASWNTNQVVAAYAGASPAEKAGRIAAAVVALQSLRGVIGTAAYDAALALLNSLL